VTPAHDTAANSGRFPWPLVLALALAQLVAWGTFYYAFAILMTPMGAELGWSKAEMNGALSLGLAVTGLAAFGAGRWIDRHGGRVLMTLGSVVGAALLMLWSGITQLWQLYAIWVCIGAVCATILYDPVFAVVARAFAADYRRAITAITLLGGLASTVFIPVTHGLVETFGWRHALLVLALIELPICAGIPWLLLRGRETAVAVAAASTASRRAGVVGRAMRQPVYWLLVASFVCFALFHTALLFNLVPLLRERGFTTGEAVAVYACIRPDRAAHAGAPAHGDDRRHRRDGAAGDGPDHPRHGCARLALRVRLRRRVRGGHGNQDYRAGHRRAGVPGPRRLRRPAGLNHDTHLRRAGRVAVCRSHDLADRRRVRSVGADAAAMRRGSGRRLRAGCIPGVEAAVQSVEDLTPETWVVMPAHAGIHIRRPAPMDSGFRRNDKSSC